MNCIHDQPKKHARAHTQGHNNHGHGNQGDGNKGNFNTGDRNVGSYNRGDCNIGDGNAVSFGRFLAPFAPRQSFLCHDGVVALGRARLSDSLSNTLSHPNTQQGNNLAGNYLFGNGDNPCPWN
jgi:hypothetical protein